MRDPIAYKVAGAAIISGTISGLTLMTVPYAYYVGPGLLFGVATGLVFGTAARLKLIQVLLWVVASTGAWFAAIEFYLSEIGHQQSDDALINLLMAGFVGAAIIAVAFSIITLKLSIVAASVTLLLGVILAGVMNAILSSGEGTNVGAFDLLPMSKMAAAFAVWQVGVGLSLLLYRKNS